MTWWDPGDQALAESGVLRRRDLGKGWIPVPMVNNVEQRDPYGDDRASVALRAVRERLVPCALDEGEAWRRRDDGALAVLRVEAFGDDASPLRSAWQANAAACLDALWRQRWREREREPGWIEARWAEPSDRPDRLRVDGRASTPAGEQLDWLTIEDHTDAAQADAVAAYEHLSVWSGRWLATLVIRHRQGAAVDGSVESAVLAIGDRLESISRRSGLLRGSA